MNPEAVPSPTASGASTLRRLAVRFRPHRGRAALVVCLLLVRSLLEVAAPWLIAALVDRLVGHEGAGGALPDSYVLLLWVLGGVYVGRLVSFYVSQVTATRLGQDIENGLRSELFEHVVHLRFRYHDENQAGKTIAHALRDMEKAKHFFREVAFGYVETGLLVLAALAGIFATHWTYGLGAGVIVALGLQGCIRVGRRIAVLDRGVSDVYDDVATALQENVAGARVVRAFGREAHEVGKFGGRLGRFTGRWGESQRYWTSIMPVVNHLYHVAIPLALAIGAFRIASGAGTIGEVTAVLLYVRTVQHRLRPLTRLVILGQQAVASATRVFEVLDRRERLPVGGGARRLPPRGGDVRLEHVRFGHGEDAPVLRGVDLHVPAGTSLGILGPTGSGKSSLVQLLPRFYDPDEGRVLLDGIDVRELDVKELRAAVALVFQEPFLFSGTVTENVGYGAPDRDPERVRRCVALAAASEFVEALPQGYDTVIGERGVSLSGGQRQRLTIARALAVDPRVLVFDDATASVDAVTEKELFQGIRSAAQGRTTIVISQRVTSVRWCDRIAVLENGVVTALGTHAELQETSPLYREIHEHQRLERVLP